MSLPSSGVFDPPLCTHELLVLEQQFPSSALRVIRSISERLRDLRPSNCVGNWNGPRALGAWTSQGLCPLGGQGVYK